jgi:hypothetical protein
MIGAALLVAFTFGPVLYWIWEDRRYIDMREYDG